MHMNTKVTAYDPPDALRRITQAYASLLLIAFALMPAQLIAYLYLRSPLPASKGCSSPM
jgi:hypothetical protein